MVFTQQEQLLLERIQGMDEHDLASGIVPIRDVVDIGATLDEVLPFLHTHLQWRELIILDQVLLAVGFATGWLYSYFAVRRYIRSAAKPL